MKRPLLYSTFVHLPSKVKHVSDNLLDQFKGQLYLWYFSWYKGNDANVDIWRRLEQASRYCKCVPYMTQILTHNTESAPLIGTYTCNHTLSNFFLKCQGQLGSAIAPCSCLFWHLFQPSDNERSGDIERQVPNDVNIGQGAIPIWSSLVRKNPAGVEPKNVIMEDT